MRRTILTAIILAACAMAFPQNKAVKWYTIQEAEKLAQQSPRPIFIDTYTDWCGWCRKMDQETFTNPVIEDILNTKFYPVKFNAEREDTVVFLGQTFVNDGKAGKAHQLAIALLRGQLSYPTVVFLFRTGNKYSAAPVPGFRQPKDMEVLLSFFYEKAYEKQSLEEYSKSFTGKVQ